MKTSHTTNHTNTLGLKLFLTIALIVSLLPMMAPQYGTVGINERNGWSNLFPIGIIGVILFLVSVWAPLKSRKLGFLLGLLGTIAIVVNEIITFICADSPNSYISLQNSFEYASPYFYLGFFTSLMMIFIYICTMSISKNSKNQKAPSRK